MAAELHRLRPQSTSLAAAWLDLLRSSTVVATPMEMCLGSSMRPRQWTDRHSLAPPRGRLLLTLLRLAACVLGRRVPTDEAGRMHRLYCDETVRNG